MALANRIPPVEREVPHEPGNFFTFRVLSAEQFVDHTVAMNERNAESISMEMRAIVNAGLIAWKGPNYDVPCDDTNRCQLDGMTRKWVMETLNELSGITQGEAESSAPGSATNGTEPVPATPSSSRSGAAA